MFDQCRVHLAALGHDTLQGFNFMLMKSLGQLFHWLRLNAHVFECALGCLEKCAADA